MKADFDTNDFDFDKEAPLLSSIQKRNAFHVPEGFFEKNANQFSPENADKKNKIINLGFYLKVASIAAIFMIGLFISTLFLDTKTADNSLSSVYSEDVINSIEEDLIINDFNFEMKLVSNEVNSDDYYDTEEDFDFGFEL